MDGPNFVAALQQLGSNPEAAHVLEQYASADTMSFLGNCTEVLLGLDDPATVTKVFALLDSILKIGRFVNENVKQLWEAIPPPLKESLERALIRGIMFQSDQIVGQASHLMAVVMKISFSLDYFMVLVNFIKSPPPDVGPGAVYGVLMAIREILVLKCMKRAELVQPWNALRDEILGLGLTILGSGEVPIEYKIQASGILSAMLALFAIGTDVEKYQIIFQAIVANWEIDSDELHGELYKLMLSVFKKGYRSLNDENFSVMCTMTQSEPGTQNMVHAEQCLRFWREVARFEEGIQGDKVRHYVVLKMGPVLMPFLMFLLRAIELRDEEDVDDVGYVHCTSREAMMTLKFIMKCVPLLPEEERMPFYNAIKEQFGGPAGSWEEMFGRLASLLSIVEDTSPQAVEILGEMITPLMGLVGNECPRISQVAIEVIGGILRYQNFYPHEMEAQMIDHLVTTCMAQGGEGVVFMCRAIQEFARKFGKNGYDNTLKFLYVQLSQVLMTVMQVGGETGNIAATAFKHLIVAAPAVAAEQQMGVFTAVMETITQIVQQPQCDMQKYLLRSAADFVFHFQGRPILSQELVGNIWGLALQVLTQSPLKDWVYDDILSVIGACINAFPQLGVDNLELLIGMIRHNLESQDLTLLRPTVILVGDLFRALRGKMAECAGVIAEGLLQCCNMYIERPDELAYCLMNLGDVVLHAAPAIQGLIPPIMCLISVVISAYDCHKDSYIDETCAVVYESVLWLSGCILNTFMGVPDFRVNKQFHECLFALLKMKHITIEKIQLYSDLLEYQQLLCMTVKFVELAIGLDPSGRYRKEDARVYNHLVNNIEIKKILQYVSSAWQGNQASESLRDFGKRARSLLQKIGKV